ncbi:MAG: ABC transporter substrate-binding protein [Clostridium perfringens]|nr:ABC transporter substrate-binding protein [Clostridium perfringens]
MKKGFLKNILTLGIIGLISGGLVGCGSNTESNSEVTSVSNSQGVNSLEKIKETGKLVIGMSADYAPYEFHKVIDGKDEVVGFDVDIANEIAESLGVKLEITEMDFGMLIAALQTGKIDMIVSGMSPNDERRENVDFSDIYYEATQSVLVLDSDKETYTTLESLANKKIGAQMGTIQVSIAEEQIENATITELTKVSQLVTELKSNKVNAVIVEKPVAETILKSNDDLFLTDIDIKYEDGGAAIAVKKGSDDLLNEINEIIDELKNSGKIDEFVVNANELASN